MPRTAMLDAGMCQPCVYLGTKAGKLWCVEYDAPAEPEAFCPAPVTIGDVLWVHTRSKAGNGQKA